MTLSNMVMLIGALEALAVVVVLVVMLACGRQRVHLDLNRRAEQSTLRHKAA